MNIKKSRIIQIIKEEMRKILEDDEGLEPMPMDPRVTLRTWFQEETSASADNLSDEKLMQFAIGEIKRLRAFTVDEPFEREHGTKTDPFSDDPRVDDTDFAPVPRSAQRLFNKKMGVGE
jgi:hypothetical protein